MNLDKQRSAYAQNRILATHLSGIFAWLIIGIFSLTCFSCQEQNKKAQEEAAEGLDLQNVARWQALKLPDSLSARRIRFALQLRDSVAKQSWPDFNTKRVEGPFVYFNGDRSELFFLDANLLKKLDSVEPFSSDYALAPRIDEIPYHFELMISFEPSDSAKIYFEQPVQQFLSVEETGNFMESVRSTESWLTMVIHEMYHHYQYNQAAFFEYARKEINALPFDPRDLRKLCKEEPEFMSTIQKENDLLMTAIANAEGLQADPAVLHELVRKYLELRQQRLDKYREAYPLLEKVENYYQIQEGSARYMEYQSMLALEAWGAMETAPQIVNDPKFSAYADFKKVDLKAEAFDYLTYAGPTNYHYTLGFNAMRLLDALGVDYKEKLLQQPGTGLNVYLEDFLK